MNLNTYRLTSLGEEPADEHPHASMEQVEVAACESSCKAKQELKRRMQEVKEDNGRKEAKEIKNS